MLYAPTVGMKYREVGALLSSFHSLDTLVLMLVYNKNPQMVQYYNNLYQDLSPLYSTKAYYHHIKRVKI